MSDADAVTRLQELASNLERASVEAQEVAEVVREQLADTDAALSVDPAARPPTEK